MCALVESALDAEELTQAAFYCRAEEFYTIPAHERESALRTIRGAVLSGLRRRGHRNPPSSLRGFMHACDAAAFGSRQAKRGTVLLHGGFDSFIEEFYSMMSYLSDAGYDVIGFDGPGQGATRRRHGSPSTTAGRSL